MIALFLNLLLYVMWGGYFKEIPSPTPHPNLFKQKESQLTISSQLMLPLIEGFGVWGTFLKSPP